MTSVRATSVSKTFGGQAVLRALDFEAGDGQIVALLGPSGCGKTTLLRLIVGFERLDEGKIKLGDETVAKPARHVPPEKRRVGYVPQEGALFPHLTVAGNVGFGLPRRERSGARVDEALELVGVEALKERYPHELSGGQQQRVALARALAPKPGVVALDEPFNGLDLDLRRAISREVIATLRRTKATAILVTHDPEEAFAAADVVAVMHEGKIAQLGDPRSVYGGPTSPAVARITGSAIFLDATIRGQIADTALGQMPLRQISPGVNGVASVCLRPEQIVVGSPGVGKVAKILERSFRGDHSVLTVSVGEKQLPVRAPAAFEADASGEVHLKIVGSCVAFEKG